MLKGLLIQANQLYVFLGTYIAPPFKKLSFIYTISIAALTTGNRSFMWVHPRKSTSKEATQVCYLPNPSLGDQPPQSEEAQAAIVKMYMKENTTSPELPDNVQASQLPACEPVTGLAATEFYWSLFGWFSWHRLKQRKAVLAEPYLISKTLKNKRLLYCHYSLIFFNQTFLLK